MSEYQYYEFEAIDRPLTEAQQAEMRAFSTRARITATQFTNEYEWGDFSGDPAWMMERYYDAHVYTNNWGTNQVVLRIPEKLLDIATVRPYLIGEQAEARVTGGHLILDFQSEDEDADLGEDPEEWLPAIVGVRTELASGDLRPLYIAWLAAIGTWERDEEAFDDDVEDELEPPVPAGLGSLTAAQQALAGFLRLDADLLATAATASPEPPTGRDDPAKLAQWIEHLQEKDKDTLLLRTAQSEAGQVHLELLNRFHGETKTHREDETAQRTVAELLDATATARQERERLAAAR